jgi:dolichol-phosphate mannosyltransferase
MSSTEPLPQSISVVVPTYQEAENIADLIGRIEAVRAEHRLELDLLVLDDPSDDGTDKIIAELDKPWVRLITRTGERGLSYAVADGLAAAAGDRLLVMDADLSHPPEAIPAMMAALDDPKVDFVIGSRYVPGASTDEDWGLMRWVNSKIATWLARPFTRAKDPMAGFFALRRETYASAEALNPIGYKIGLELLVKCGCRNVAEVPIHFADRAKGQSKLNLSEQLRYLRHLKRLADYKYGALSHFIQFGAIGAAGTAVNIVALILLMAAGMLDQAAVAAAIGVAMTHNFFLNRWITFSYAKHISMFRQYRKFVATCLLGAVINYSITVWLWDNVAFFAEWKPAAVVVGVLGGMFFNFFGSKLWIFKKQDPATA